MTSLLKRSMRMAKLALLASAVMSPALMADSNLPISTPVTVTLANGVKVLLKPDHSWEYQLDAPDTAASQVTSGNTIPTSAAIPVTAAVAPVGSAPVDSASVGRGGDSSDSIAVSSSARQAQPASRLNDSALANPQLLSEGHRDGLVARLAKVNVKMMRPCCDSSSTIPRDRASLVCRPSCASMLMMGACWRRARYRCGSVSIACRRPICAPARHVTVARYASRFPKENGVASWYVSR